MFQKVDVTLKVGDLAVLVNDLMERKGLELEDTIILMIESETGKLHVLKAGNPPVPLLHSDPQICFLAEIPPEEASAAIVGTLSQLMPLIDQLTHLWCAFGGKPTGKHREVLYKEIGKVQYQIGVIITTLKRSFNGDESN